MSLFWRGIPASQRFKFGYFGEHKLILLVRFPFRINRKYIKDFNIHKVIFIRAKQFMDTIENVK
jgi:hypothetical protein